MQQIKNRAGAKKPEPSPTSLRSFPDFCSSNRQQVDEQAKAVVAFPKVSTGLGYHNVLTLPWIHSGCTLDSKEYTNIVILVYKYQSTKGSKRSSPIAGL